MRSTGGLPRKPSLSLTASPRSRLASAPTRSHLLSSITIGQPAASTRSARRWSWWVTPTEQSITSRATSAESTARSARTSE